METKTVYVVLSPDYQDAEDIYGVFDSKELLGEFLDRFKERGDGYEIVETPLNPKFRGDKSRDPYLLSLQRNGEVNLFVISRPSDTEKAIAGVHEIYEIDEEPWALHCYMLAETKEEAWYKGKPLLEKLVERGEFKLDGEIH